MKAKLEAYRQVIYMSIILITLGVIYITALSNPLGAFLIAVGGFFILIGVNTFDHRAHVR